ncbi:MAG: hypothetical protein GH151_01070 [Bacteroidetes bacterium]|nr:hypothetical protein [Bacteroidota bacterium]
MKKIIYFAIIMALITYCVPPEVGYISDNIHALEDTIFVPRGVFATSAAPAAEGSTYPMHWEFTDITDGNGTPTDALFTEYEILTWKSSFNPETDTTMAIASEKLELSDQPSILINTISGEMAFTQATKFVTENDIYHVSVNVSNVRGSRQLDNFVIIKLTEFRPVEFPTTMRSRLQLGKGGGSYDIAYTYEITGDNSDRVPGILDGTDPYITILKVSEEPSMAFKAKMIIADSHGGVPILPSKVVFYPSGSTYLANLHDNSVETVDDATGTTFNLPAPPFPQFSRTYTGSNSYLMYYLTTDDAFYVDTVAWVADYGPKDWSAYRDPGTNEIRCRAYIRWGIKINDSGTWELKMKIPYTITK